MKKHNVMSLFVCCFLQITLIGSFSAGAFAQASLPFTENNIVISDGGEKTGDFYQLNASAAAEVTSEESDFIGRGLLPVYYPVLKQCLDGKGGFTGKNAGLTAAKNLCKSFFPTGSGNYSRDFGNPVKMLEWARKNAGNEKLCKLVTSARRGDVMLSGPSNKKSIDSNFICLMTKGPYYHAVLVIDGPPPVVIEAVGLTGNRFDTTSDKVRMSSWYEEYNTYTNYRLVRPTFGEKPAKAGEMIEKAVSYAEAQLGRPYDYSFSDSDGTRAFYCSELVSKAYREGAGLEIAEKNAERDKIIIAIHGAIDGLEPKNKFALSDKVMRFAVEYSSTKPADIEKLQSFIIDDLIPDCKLLERAFPNQQARDKLNAVFNKIKSNEGFKKFTAAIDAYEADKKSGKFDAGWGIGKLRKLKSEAAIGLALLKDIDLLAKESGASRKNLLVVFTKLFLPIYQNLGTYGELLTGMNRDSGLPLAPGVQTVLKIVDWGVNKREQVKKWPVVGNMLAALMPGNGDGKTKTDFVSPSDLAHASPGFAIDCP